MNLRTSSRIPSTIAPVSQIYRVEMWLLAAVAIPGLVEGTRSSSGISLFVLFLVLFSAVGMRASLTRRQGHFHSFPDDAVVELVRRTVLRCLVQNSFLVGLVVLGAWVPWGGGGAAGIASGLLVTNVLKRVRMVRTEKVVGRIYLDIQRRDWFPRLRDDGFATRLYAQSLLRS